MEEMDIEQRIIRNWKIGVTVVVALLALAIVWPLASVPTGSRGVITVGGKITQIEGEGYTLLWPWQKLSLFSIRAEQADIDKAEGATSDTQPVHVSLTVRYSISPDKVAEVFERYSHDGNLSSYAQTATQEIFKAVTARYTAVDLIGKRAQVSADIREALQTKLAIYGAQVINIDMRNFAFSSEYMSAINDKVTQEQKKLAADNKALTAASEQKIKVVTAEADANAVRAKADGDAYATLVRAKAAAEAARIEGTAKADAMRAQANAISANPALIQMKIAEQWNGELPTWMQQGGGALPMLQLPGLPKHSGIKADTKGD